MQPLSSSGGAGSQGDAAAGAGGRGPRAPSSMKAAAEAHGGGSPASARRCRSSSEAAASRHAALPGGDDPAVAKHAAPDPITSASARCDRDGDAVGVGRGAAGACQRFGDGSAADDGDAGAMPSPPSLESSSTTTSSSAGSLRGRLEGRAPEGELITLAGPRNAASAAGAGALRCSTEAQCLQAAPRSRSACGEGVCTGPGPQTETASANNQFRLTPKRALQAPPLP